MTTLTSDEKAALIRFHAGNLFALALSAAGGDERLKPMLLGMAVAERLAELRYFFDSRQEH